MKINNSEWIGKKHSPIKRDFYVVPSISNMWTVKDHKKLYWHLSFPFPLILHLTLPPLNVTLNYQAHISQIC